MRMLIISPFFHPELISTGRYNRFLVKGLVRQGIKVDVICFHPLYPGWRPRRCIDGLGDVGIYRGGAWIRYPKSSLLRRAALECGFLLHMLRNAGRIRRYSRIVAVLPPMLFLPLAWMAAGPDARVTAIVHDLQGVMAGVGIRRGRRFMISMVRFLEALVLRCCHKVIALSNGMAGFLSSVYKIRSSKIAVCWPFVTLSARKPGSRLGPLFDDEKKHIVYSGALGEKQNPEGLIYFFQRLLDSRSDVVCHVFSGGPLFERFRRDFRAIGLRLVFHDLLPEQDLAELYLRSHIQVIPETIGFSEGAVPSKLPNLLAAGVPILYIGAKSSDVWQVIQSYDAGLCSDSWDAQRLITLADRLLLDYYDRSRADRRWTFDRTLADIFSIETLIRELVG